MTCGIYCITNLINGKQYIGQSTNIELRFRSHKSSKDNYPIHNAIQKYGEHNFKFEIICKCSEDKLDEEEIKFINLYSTVLLGYNLTYGGQGGKKSETAKENMSKSKNTTGFLNVSKVKSDTAFQGFFWAFQYVDNKNVHHRFVSVNLIKLKEKVIENGLKWKIIDENQASLSLKENEDCLSLFKKGTNTGYYGVSKVSHKRVKQGFIYQYNLPYRSNKINSSFGSVSLKKLKEKVIKKGLPWGIIDEQKVMEMESVEMRYECHINYDDCDVSE